MSESADLVPRDRNDVPDIFVHDRKTGDTSRVSVNSSGAEGNDDSGLTIPAISADGCLVAFASRAANLVPGDTNGAIDVFVRDRCAGSTKRVSVATGGAQADAGGQQVSSLSADGRFVAFSSSASNLVAGDTNAQDDVFVHDQRKGTTERVSVGPGGAQADGGSREPAISADGHRVAYHSSATNLVPGDTNGLRDVFVRDRLKGNTVLVSQGLGGVPADRSPIMGSALSSISADGRFVAFCSSATNLVKADTNDKFDMFVRDLWSNRTVLVSVGPSGAQGIVDTLGRPGLSRHGMFVAFGSRASNFVAGDANGAGDVFVRAR